MLTVGSLFSGIGGFDLAADRAGLDVKWQVEIDDYCTRVLERHWPHVQRFRDIRTVRTVDLATVDVVCGGFPCQDVSSNNQYKRGVEGRHSSLFREALRIVGDIRPRYVVLENVADLLVRGMGTVLGELAALGFDAEWECLPAAAFGLPQPRWRVFLVAYPDGSRCQTSHEWFTCGPFARARLDDDGLGTAEQRASTGVATLCGMDDGAPGGMDRVAACGNSIVPQVAEWIFRRILAVEAMTCR